MFRMIQYNLQNGLDLLVETMQHKAHPRSLRIPSASFTPINLTSEASLLVDRLMQTPRILKKDKCRLTALEIERSGANSNLLFGMSWGSNFEHPIGTAMLASMVETISDANIIAWNAFGHGTQNRSSRINPSALKHAAKSGSFSLIGKEYAERLKTLLDNDMPVDLIGVSEGGRIVLAMVPFLGKKVRNVILLDPPGSINTTLAGFMKRFKGEELHTQKYIKASLDKQSRKLLTHYNEHRIKAVLQDVIRSPGMLRDHYYLSPLAMAKGGLGQDLYEASPYVSGKLAFILPSGSLLNKEESVRNGLRKASAHNPQLRTELWTFEGTHSLINAGPMAQASLLSFVLKQP